MKNTQKTMAAIAIGILVGCYAQPAFPFCIYNNSDIKIKAWVDPGDFSKEIKPGQKECCNWKNTDCNPKGKRTSTLQLWIDSKDKDSHFSAILPLKAGGYAKIKQKSRKNLGVDRKNLYVETYTHDGKLVVRAPYGVHAQKRDVHFLATGDPQYFKYYKEEKNRRKSDAVFKEMVHRLQKSCSSTKYLGDCEIRGMIVAGDLSQQAKKEELSWYKDGGIKGAVRFGYEGLGNHDYGHKRMKNFVLKDRRRSTVATATQAPHYSWDWHDVHFVQLNLFPGNEHSKAHKDLDPFKSLDFLKNDLKKHVGNDGRPVVLIHHYGFDPFSEGNEGWWSDEQRKKYWNTIAPYNVKAIFTGHEHLSANDAEDKWHRKWSRPSGTTKGPKYIDSFISGATLNGVFLDVRIDEENLTVQRWGIKPGKNAKKAGGPVSVSMK